MREGSLQVSLTPTGLLIPSRYFGNGQSTPQGCTLMAVEVLNTDGTSWSLNLSDLVDNENKQIWVSLQNSNKEDPCGVPAMSDIIFILDTSFSAVETTTRRGRPGCCLVVKKKGSREQNTTKTSYICPISWGRGTPGPHCLSNNAENGKILGADSPNVLIISDVASWKHVEARRDLFMPESFGSRVKLILIL